MNTQVGEKWMVCTSCKVNLLGDTKFVQLKCPNCGEVDIFRCSKCRRLSNIYKCSKCGFEGP
ncbi:MAG: zinc finger domain-containing protein [Candidatus Aenigmatarchaeota archaeon]